MRLLLASYYYPPSVGGVERQSHLLARALLERGHDVQVVSARLDGMTEREILDGVPVRRVSPGRGSRVQKMATYLAGLAREAVRRRSTYDLVQVQQALYPAAAMAVVARMLQKPLVVRNSGSGEFGAVQLMGRLPLGPFGLRLIARGATTISLNDEMTREMRGAGFRRLVEIPNGVVVPPAITDDERARARASLGTEGPLALYFGRFDREKGVDLLLDAWGRHAPGNGALFVVGEGPEEPALRTQLAALGPAGARVRFVPFTRELRPYVAAADVFVLPSRSEGISNALLEAMAAGLPPVATAVGGNRFVLEDGRFGRLTPFDADAFGRELRALLDAPERARALGEVARAHVTETFSVAAMVDRYEQLYTALLTRK